jgi:hypothetical protein
MIFELDVFGEDVVVGESDRLRIEVDNRREGRNVVLVKDEEHIVAWGSELWVGGSGYLEGGGICALCVETEEILALVVAVSDGTNTDPIDFGVCRDIISGGDSNGKVVQIVDVLGRV